MSKRRLRSDLAELESDIIETLIAGHKEWRPDLSYPESHSDMQAAVRGLLRMYKVERHPIAVELEYHVEAPEMLTRHFKYVWQQEVSNGKTTSSFETWVAHGGHFKSKESTNELQKS